VKGRLNGTPSKTAALFCRNEGTLSLNGEKKNRMGQTASEWEEGMGLNRVRVRKKMSLGRGKEGQRKGRFLIYGKKQVVRI